MDTLTELESQILNLERIFWKTAEAKEQAVRELGLSPVRYYQLLARLLDDPAARAADPLLVDRLRRVRTDRRRSFVGARQYN